MDDKKERIEGLLKNQITDAENYIDAKIAPVRSLSYDYYYGKLPAPRKNAPPIVKNVVFEKIQGALANIKEPFLSGRDVVKFIPFTTKDGYGSCIASSVVNRILKVDNNIDIIYEQLILDGLLTKSGTIKVTWKESEEYIEESFTGLTEAALEMLLDQDDVELIESEEIDPPFDLMQLMQMLPPAVLLSIYPAGPQVLAQKATDWKSLMKELPSLNADIKAIMDAGTLYSGVIEREHDTSTVKVVNVAPENFLIDESATCIEDATFVAERSRITISELAGMGFKQALVVEVSESSNGTYGDLGDVSMSRNSVDDTDNREYKVEGDESQRYIDLYECYVETVLVEHASEKASGKRSKLYQMYYANGILLEYSEVDAKPFFTWTPFKIPHKFFGQSMAETLFTQQDTATAALRGAIQYLSFSTNPRYKAIGDAQYNLAAFQANLPGSVVPVTKGDLVPFQYPALDQGIFQILQTVEASSDSISGVSNMSLGLNPDTLRSNVAGSTVALQMDASGKRLKGYALNLANQCIKPAYAYVYELFRKNSEKDIIVQVDGRDVNVDPKSLPIRKNLEIDYSLGKNDKIEHAMALLQTKQRIELNPQLMKYHTPAQAYQLEQDIMSNSGVYDVTRYLTNPGNAPAQPTAAEQQQLKLTQSQQAIDKQQADNAALDLEIRKAQLSLEDKRIDLEAMRITAQINIEKMKLDHKEKVDADEQNRKDEELRFKQESTADSMDLEESELEASILKDSAEIQLETVQKRGIDIG